MVYFVEDVNRKIIVFSFIKIFRVLLSFNNMLDLGNRKMNLFFRDIWFRFVLLFR